ncbi:MAG TPA: hypothetical protein VEW74_05160 [Candidatus Nitrosotalea sp.]|nr:hypothetical protein [Candidatus Nitrosotalea sp.]
MQRTAPRLGAIAIALVIIGTIAILPERYHILPEWFSYVASAAILIPMIVVASTKGRLRRSEQIIELVAISSALAFNGANVLVTAYNVVENPAAMQPVPLFYTSVAIWTGNFLIFALMYWLIDGGGPDARINEPRPLPDFDFPAMEDERRVAMGWQPGIIDYLFLAFTTSTAFSPTEAMPMTARAKILMVFQSCVSLITILIVAARTINILK